MFLVYKYVQLSKVCFPRGSTVENLPVLQETQVQSLGQEDPWEEGMGTIPNSCLENPVDREAWQVILHRVTKSWT